MIHSVQTSAKYFIAFLLCILCSSGNSFADAEKLSRTLYIPERIILNLTENPAISQAVTWRTGAAVSKPKAQIVLATETKNLKKNAKTMHAVSEPVRINDDTYVYHHCVVFKSLKPDTLYAYRVGAKKHWSEWNQFQTASTSHEPFKFVYLGDPQEKIKSMCSRIFRAAYKKAGDADFWLFAGDLVDDGDRDEEWAELFYAFGWIPRMTPMIFLPGNHSYPYTRHYKDRERALFHLWRPHFTLPENGPDGLKETAYFIDYQGVRFVMLNGNEKLDEQIKWMDIVLSQNPQPWTIAAIHQPVYPTAKRRNHPPAQQLFIPVFDKYSVDLVLQGHDHAYSRTYKLKNGIRVSDNEKGTVYVISVSGPKVYSVNSQHEQIMVKTGTGRQLFQVIRVDQNRLRYESYNALGKLYDSFELKK